MNKRKTSQHFPHKWLRRALLALGTFYLIFVIWLLFNDGLFTLLGWDFPSFYASAQIAVTEGFDRIYDLDLQRVVQQSLMSPYASSDIETAPTFYLPIFVVPFCLFLPLGLRGGFAVWTLLNLLVLVGYLHRFWDIWRSKNPGFDVREALSDSLGKRVALALAMFSLPIFMNFFSGQVSVWLLICVGEFLWAWEQKKAFRSGLWLGGLLIKPQTLILLLPFLVFSKEWSILGGFAVASTVIGAISLSLAGLEGLKAWLDLLVSYTGDLPTVNPQMMPNIRMVGTTLSLLLPSDIVRWITIGLSGAIALFVLGRSLSKWGPEKKSGALLPLMAATSLVAWHTHIHMAAILIPPLLHQARSGRLPYHFLALWAILPPVGFLGGMINTLLFIYLVHQLPPIPALTFSALILFVLHLYIIMRDP